MNNLRSVLAVLFFGVLFSVSAVAQAQTAPKIYLINTDFFYDEKAGITKLVTASKQLDTEFAARVKELTDGDARLKTIAKEIQSGGGPSSNPAALRAKQEEGESLQRTLNYKKTDLEAAVAKRRQALIAPISQDIGKGIDDFAKKNGYGVIFDAAKLADSGSLLFLGDAADITKEFITFYNARPATAATPR